MGNIRVLLAGESWVSAAMYVKGFDYFAAAEYQIGIAALKQAYETNARPDATALLSAGASADSHPLLAVGMFGAGPWPGPLKSDCNDSLKHLELDPLSAAVATGLRPVGGPVAAVIL